MSSARPVDYLTSLVHELRALPQETDWAEFKINEVEPQTNGEYISASPNSAGLAGKAVAFLNYGVRDMIAIADQDVGPRSRNYLPYWAVPGSDRGEVV